MRATSLLASFSRRNFGTRSLMSENSELAYSNVSKEMQNDEHMDTPKDEKMKAQTTRQTARKTAISNWFKNFIKYRYRKQTFTFNSIPEILSLAGAVEWPQSVCAIGATLGTSIIHQSTLVDIWKQQQDIDKRPAGMDNAKRLHELLNIFYFQIANFFAIYNLSCTCHSNYKINGIWTSMQKLKKRTHTWTFSCYDRNAVRLLCRIADG